MEKIKNKKLTTSLVILAIAIIASAIVGFTCFVSVPAGHTGVVVSFGKVEDYVLNEGLHAKLPWQEVINMDNRAQKEVLTMAAFSSDIQQVEVNCAVNFSVDKETSQNLFRHVGETYYDKVVQPRVCENLKSVFANYSAENLVGSREILSDEIEKLLAPEMKEYGIELINISIEDIDFTDVFTDAVEAKQVAEQAKLQAQTEQEQKTMEQQAAAERDVIAAQAEADVKKIEADAAAYAINVQAEAEAEANAKIAASLTPELIDYTEIEQWDGKLPEIYGAESVIPVLGDKDAADTTNP